mgnify:CR=1 FL=1|jgi:DNA mismatch endonuclease (patch repair protein)
MSRIKGKNTKPEIILRQALWAAGMRYRLKNKLPGHPDLFFPGKKIAIFVDGCFWHGCPEHSQIPKANRNFWEEKLSKNKERDKEVNRILEGDGWHVLRFWEHEVKQELASCVKLVSEALKKSSTCT